MPADTKLLLQKYFPWLLLAGILVNATGLLSEILEPDGTLYACIAKHMATTGDWVNLWGYGHDWLDKPHFPFWVTALSFKLFGINAFAYKLPAFLFWLLGLRFTYLLAATIYNDNTGKLAVLIYTIAAHSVIANFDVRAEPYLTTFTIAGIYYLYRAYAKKKFTYLLWGAIMTACAVMTKGIFILITISGGMVLFWMITGQWREFINYRWWLLVVLIGIFITPELYCLYMQFDMHPEKIAWGRTNVSGIRFFFWDSQFGRFMNTGPIKGTGDFFFFFHTTLWAFLPWPVIFFIAVTRLIAKKTEVKSRAQWIIFGSAIITFLLFSLSSFQLPHYIIILFPHFSMITAQYLLSVEMNSSARKLMWAQYILLLLASVAVVSVLVYAHLQYAVPYIIFMVVVLIAGIYFFRKPGLAGVVGLGYVFAVIAFLFMNLLFYPQVLPYQGGMAAARWLNEHKTSGETFMYKNEDNHSFEFYADRNVLRSETPEEIATALGSKAGIVYTGTDFVDSVKHYGLHVDTLAIFDHFHISKMTLKFLNPVTRQDQLQQVCLLKVYQAPNVAK